MMTIPAWILDFFAAIMLTVAAVSAGRLLTARQAGRRWPDGDVDAAHILMGVAMAGMLASGLHTLPDGLWAAIFAVITIWFSWQVISETRAQGAAALGTGHHLPHLVHGAAMVYMLLAVSSGMHGAAMGMGGAAGASSMGTLRVPTLGFAFALFLAAWAVWDLDQIGAAHLRAHTGARLSRPGPQPAMALAVAGSAEPTGLAGGEPGAAFAATGPAAAAAAVKSALAAESAPAAARHDLVGPLSDPRVAVACRIAMGVTMAFMLVIML